MINIELKSIYLENFKCISELRLDLDQNLYLVYGRNGSGKTSLFESVYTCLYNRRPNGQPASSVIKNGKKNSTIELLFVINGESYKFTRVIGFGSKFIVETDNDKISGSETKQLVEDLIPKYVVNLSLLKDIDIKDILSKLINIEQITDLAREKLKNIQIQISNNNNKRQLTDSEISRSKNSIEDYRSQKIRLNQEIQNTVSEPNFSIDEIQQIIEKRSRLDKLISEKINLLQDKIFLEIQVIDQNLSKKYQVQGNIQSKISQLQSIPTEGVCPLCKQEINEEHSRHFKEELAKLIKEQDNLYLEINTIKGEKSNKSINRNQIVNECMQEVNIQPDELNVDINRVMSHIKAYQEQENNRQIIQTKIDSLDERIKELQSQIELLQQDLINRDTEIKKLKNVESLYEILSNKRLIKKVASNLSTEVLNFELSKMSNIFDVQTQITDSDDINLIATNNNNEIVSFNDLSQGEQALAKLTLYLAIRNILSNQIVFKTLFFDEFIDHLDMLSSAKLLPVLKQLSENDKIFVITFNNAIYETDIWDNTINMESYH